MKSGGASCFLPRVELKADARVCLIGFPSVGKSTLLSKTTKTESAVGAYEFTTLTARRTASTLTPGHPRSVGVRGRADPAVGSPRYRARRGEG